MVDRRQVLAGMASAALVSCADRIYANPLRATSSSLVPQIQGQAPNYWCTWAAQNYMFGQDLPDLDPAILEGESGSKLAANAMSESVVFGRNGWANKFFSKICSDLFLLLDDGWESGGTATF